MSIAINFAVRLRRYVAELGIKYVRVEVWPPWAQSETYNVGCYQHLKNTGESLAHNVKFYAYSRSGTGRGCELSYYDS